MERLLILILLYIDVFYIHLLRFRSQIIDRNLKKARQRTFLKDDAQTRKIPDSQLSGAVHFGKGVSPISHIKIDSDQAVKIAIDQKRLEPGSLNGLVTGYHFKMGETVAQSVPKVITTVIGISPDGAMASVDIDPVT